MKKINDIVYRVRKVPNGKPKLVHFNSLAPFQCENDNKQEVRQLSAKKNKLSYKKFMGAYGGIGKARFGVTSDVHKDLFTRPSKYSLVQCISSDLDSRVDQVFRRKFEPHNKLLSLRPTAGGSLKLDEDNRFLFYLVTKSLSNT